MVLFRVRLTTNNLSRRGDDTIGVIRDYAQNIGATRWRVITQGVEFKQSITRRSRTERFTFDRNVFGRIRKGTSRFIDILFERDVWIYDCEGYQFTFRSDGETLAEAEADFESFLNRFPEFSRFTSTCGEFERRTIEFDEEIGFGGFIRGIQYG